jgi:hypothetical protein
MVGGDSDGLPFFQVADEVLGPVQPEPERPAGGQ